MDGWCPRLRGDVEWISEEELRDRPLQRRVRLGVISRALAAKLDGSHPVSELVALASQESGADPGEVEEALRMFLLLDLVEGAGEPHLARAREIAGGEPRPAPEVLAGARFGCAGSGQCCHVYRPGPLTDDDLTSLEEGTASLRSAFPGLPESPWHETREGPDGLPWRYLRRSGGHCVFLQEDQRCAVHAALGVERKPEACRLFPFDAVRTLDGLRVFDVSQCSAFATTCAQGETHAQHLAGVTALLPRRPRLFHPRVLLAPGGVCDYAHVRPLELAWLELLGATPPLQGLSEGAALARALGDALLSCPLAPGEPDATVARTLALPAVPQPPSAHAFALAALAVSEALGTAARALTADEAPLIEPFADALGALRSLAAARAGLADGALPEVLERALALPLDGELVRQALGASLRNRLFGSRLLVRERLRAGVLRLACLCLLALVGARLRAAVSGAERVEASHLSAGHWFVSLAMERDEVTASLVEVEEHAWCLAAGAPGLGLGAR